MKLDVMNIIIYISVCIHNSFIYIYNRITQISKLRVWKHFFDYFIIKDYNYACVPYLRLKYKEFDKHFKTHHNELKLGKVRDITEV